MAYDLLRGKTTANWARQVYDPRVYDPRVCNPRVCNPRVCDPRVCDPSSSAGALPTGATGYAPTSWWTAAQAEAKVREFEQSGGLFGTKLPREYAERRALEFLRKRQIGIMSGSIGSWLLSDKEQERLLKKVDDVRYDIRLASRRAGIGMGLLAGALGLLGIASIYKTGVGDKAKGYGNIARYK